MSMDASHGDVNRRLGELKRDFDYELSAVQSKLSEVEETVERLPYRVDTLESELEEAKEQIGQTTEDLESSVSAVEGAVERVSRRVAALERRARQAADAVVVDLDADPGAELHRLALAVEEGAAAQAQILPDWQRAALETPIGQLSRALEERGHHRRIVLRAAKVLAATAADHPGRKAAEHDFKTAAPKAQQAHDRIAPLRQKVEEARPKLEADDNARTRYGKTIGAGERADTKLRTRLRSRLAEAVSGKDLLPVWFETALGPLPPHRNPNAWMETATDLLAYRITYRIIDPVVPLGQLPAHAVPRRRSRHEELTRELKRWA
ncbi:CopG family transcriptional regulator [Streptomyces violaceusniger]|uniref:CopG family transcriptional regulator n=1 Tax=Streptomyces violaceusniger TaxID=68280 RepID=UPI003430C037